MLSVVATTAAEYLACNGNWPDAENCTVCGGWRVVQVVVSTREEVAALKAMRARADE
jgi:hypothetical protein